MVELGAVGLFAGALGGATAQVVDQRAVEVGVAVIVVTIVNEFTRGVRGYVEGKLAGALLQAVDADIHVAVFVRGEGEAYLAGVRETPHWVASEVEVDDGRQRELGGRAGGVDTDQERVDAIFALCIVAYFRKSVSDEINDGFGKGVGDVANKVAGAHTEARVVPIDVVGIAIGVVFAARDGEGAADGIGGH